MRSPFMKYARVAPAFFTAALLAVLALAVPATVTAGGGGIAYDEVTRFITSDKAPPAPGGFANDFQAAVDAQRGQNTAQHHGLFGAMINMANAMKSGLSVFTTGAASTHYFYNGWTRTDNPGAQTATIERPDRKQEIILNLAAKTYRIVDVSAPSSSTPAPYPQPPSNAGPQAAPQPGTGKLDVTASSSLLGPKTIDGYPTTGYAQDFKAVASQSTGSCRDGEFGTSMTEYFSNYASPRGPSIKVEGVSFSGAPPPQAMGQKAGCDPKIAFHHGSGARPPGDKLVLWMLATLKGKTSSENGQTGGSFSTLIERGNVRALGPNDAGLFDVPAGFTKE